MGLDEKGVTIKMRRPEGRRIMYLPLENEPVWGSSSRTFGQKVRCIAISMMRPLPMVFRTTPSVVLVVPGAV